MANEEIQHVSWDFYGDRLDQVQRCQRLFNVKGNDWGFKDAFILALAYAIMMGESGGYLKAYHHNVERNDDRTIARYYFTGTSYVTDQSQSVDGFEYMKVLSTDWGFIQRNVVNSPAVFLRMDATIVKKYVDDFYLLHPELADGYKSSNIAWNMSKKGTDFTPWFAYDNGGYKKSLGNACVAVGKFLANKYLNDPDYVIVNPDRV
jgi:hypothetical protein